jgi:hypothetical protein
VNLGRPDHSGARQKGRSDFTLTDFEKNLVVSPFLHRGTCMESVRISESSQALLSLVSGLPRAERAGRLVLMLQAFIDDSGSHETSKLFVVGGYVASVEAWSAFSVAWQAALDDPPTISGFHARDMLGQREVFKGLTEQQVWDKVGLLCPIIRDHVICGCAVGIVKDAYDKFLAGRVDKLYTSPFLPCYALLLKGLQTYLNHQKIAVVFDHQRGIGPRSQSLLGSLDQDGETCIDSVTFGNDSSFLPLQAADLYAWRILRRSLYGKETFVHEPHWAALNEIMTIAPGVVGSDVAKGPVVPPKFMKSFADQLARDFPA